MTFHASRRSAHQEGLRVYKNYELPKETFVYFRTNRQITE